MIEEMKHVYVRNIEPATYQFLVERADQLSSDDNKVSVNQVIGLILNQHYHNHLLRDELTEIEKVGQRMDSLTEAVSMLALTYQELFEERSN